MEFYLRIIHQQCDAQCVAVSAKRDTRPQAKGRRRACSTSFAADEDPGDIMSKLPEEEDEEVVRRQKC